MNEQHELVRRFFSLIEAFSVDEHEYAQILHPEIEQTEFPNAMTKQLRVQRFADIMVGTQAGRKILSSQKIDIRQSFSSGDSLVVEATWTGEMAIDAGSLKKGQTLKAYICFIFEFRDGKIYRQRNYDCYES